MKLTKEDYLKLSKERLAELLVQKDNESITLQPTPFPQTIIQQQARPLCYEPGGTCINPQMDCVNCPRHGVTGGTWSTNTNDINREYEVKQGNNQTDLAQGISVLDDSYKLT